MQYAGGNTADMCRILASIEMKGTFKPESESVGRTQCQKFHKEFSYMNDSPAREAE